MAYKKSAFQLFIDSAKEVFLSLSKEEREVMLYTDFLNRTIKKYSDIDYDDFDRSSGYKYFSKYYYGHKLTKKNPENIKPKKSNLTFEYLEPLLDYDTRRTQLLKALGDEYRYSWFFKNVYIEDGTKKSRMFLVIESKDEVIESIYDILSSTYTEMFKSMYVGYGGLVLVFYKKEKFEKFIEYIKKEE